jgi:hypothetical protein
MNKKVLCDTWLSDTYPVTSPDMTVIGEYHRQIRGTEWENRNYFPTPLKTEEVRDPVEVNSVPIWREVDTVGITVVSFVVTVLLMHRCVRQRKYIQLLFLVHLSFRITPDFPPVKFSPTDFPPSDLNFSLTDFAPTSSEVVLTLLSLVPSLVFVFSSHTCPFSRTVSSGLQKKFTEKQEVVKFSVWHNVTDKPSNIEQHNMEGGKVKRSR